MSLGLTCAAVDAVPTVRWLLAPTKESSTRLQEEEDEVLTALMPLPLWWRQAVPGVLDFPIAEVGIPEVEVAVHVADMRSKFRQEAFHS